MPSSPRAKGIKSVYILNDKQAYGLGVATNFRDAAKSLGIKIAGFDAWDSKATSYTSTYDKIKQTGRRRRLPRRAHLRERRPADQGQGRRARAERRRVKLIAPDGFTTQATIDEAGAASAGMYLSVAGQPIDAFQGKAKEFVDGLLAGPLSGKPIDPYAIYGGQAAQVMLDAIAASDGSRSDVISKLFASDVQDGLLGTFTFSEDGDPVAARRCDVAITVYKAKDKLVTETTITPKQTTVDAALGK